MTFIHRGLTPTAQQQIADQATNDVDPGDEHCEAANLAAEQQASDNHPSPPAGAGIIVSNQEDVNPDEDATPERIEAYDLDLADLQRELRAYVKTPARPTKARSTPTALPEPPRARRSLEGVCDALVIFIYPEICLGCAAIHRNHFVGIRRPLHGGGHAYIRCDVDSPSGAVARHLPIYRRIQSETYVPVCSQCCADFPIEQTDPSERIEVNYPSRTDSESDFEAFCQPARKLRQEETPDESTNDQ